jgi:hypothetical protein
MRPHVILSTRQALGLTSMYKTRVLKLSGDKYSSLFGLFVSDEEEKFYYSFDYYFKY